MENNAQTMGRRIAAQRKKMGLTQEQLSQRLGVTPQAVSKWENDLCCPDISILPELARELEMSVDALLGQDNQEEKADRQSGKKQYIVIKKETEGEEDTMNDSTKEKGNFSLRFKLNDKWGVLLMALLLVGAGVLFLLQEVGILTLAEDINLWGILWPLLVLAAGISALPSDINACTLGIVVFGLYKLLYNLGLLPVSWDLTWSMAWPIILILVGLTVLQNAVFPKKKRKNKSAPNVQRNTVSDCEYADGVLRVECAFGSMNPRPEGPFTGGAAEVSFGECTLDLTGCESFAENATLKVAVSFGQMTVIVPKTVRVKLDSESAFGSSSAPSPVEGTTCTLLVKGDCSFGHLQVKYGE